MPKPLGRSEADVIIVAVVQAREIKVGSALVKDAKFTPALSGPLHLGNIGL